MSAAKWRISSSARDALTSFLSAMRSVPTLPGLTRRVAEAVDRLLDIAPGDAALPEDRILLSSFLASSFGRVPEAISELLDCVRAPSSSPSVLVPPLESSGGGLLLTGDLDRGHASREACDAVRSRLDWLVEPTLHLASLSIAREEVLARAGTDLEDPGDSRRLDAIDAQLESALRGPSSEKFRAALLVLSRIIDLQKSWPGDLGERP